MSERQDDSVQPATPRGRSWIRSLAMVGLVLLALSAVTETVTQGQARRLVGAVVLLALVAFVVAGAAWLFEPRQPQGAAEDTDDEQTDDEDADATDEDEDEDAPEGAEPDAAGTSGTAGRTGQRAGTGAGGAAARTAGSPGQARKAGPGAGQHARGASAGGGPQGRAGGGEQGDQRGQRGQRRGGQAPAQTPAAESGPVDLPHLSELGDAELGPTPTQYSSRGRPPYVKRPATDTRLAALLNADGPPYAFVVVVGPAKSGKSRTALEAVRSSFGRRDPFVFVPVDGDELATMMRSDPAPPPDRQPWVMWMDDLTAADLAHLTSDVIDVAERQGVLVATMTQEHWRQVWDSTDEVTSTARAALARATMVPLEFELTPSEKADAEQLYPRERIRSSIAEALVGGERLVEKFRSGRESVPAGYAIVQAAVDARRAGLNRPVTETELRVLYPLYLRRVRIDLDPTTAMFEEGMTWAKEPVGSEVALLRPVNEAGDLDVLDYAVAAEEGRRDDGDDAGPDGPGRTDDPDARTERNGRKRRGGTTGGHDDPQVGHGRAVHDAMWQELIAAVPADDAYDIGIGACLYGNVQAAELAFGRAESRRSRHAARAANNLGLLLRQHGDVSGARAAFQRAMDTNDSDVAPRAANNLGTLLREQRDIRGARAAYQRAIDSGHPDVVPRAANNLGSLLREQGDVTGSRVAYQRAVDSGHADVVPVAALNLGVLLKDQGDGSGARSAFQRAVDSGHPDVVPVAALNLGSLLREQGDGTGARAAYQRAVDSGHPDVVPVAALNLGVLLREQGDVAGARVAYQRAVDSDRPDVVPAAALNLGVLLGEHGDGTGAEAAFQRAVDSGDADVVPMAAYYRAGLLKTHGDLAGAEAAYQRAVESEHNDVGPRAANNLGVLLAQQGETDRAKAAYEVALESGHSDVAPRAANNLGVLLADADDVAGARAAYDRAVSSGHAEVAPMAALNLGMLLDGQGDIVGAREAYQRAVDSGHTPVIPIAAVNLGALLREQGDVAGARTAFHLAIDAGYLDIPPVPVGIERMLLAEQDGVVGAQTAYRLATETGQSPTAVTGRGRSA
jgi:tetratricopeptide (TPR) repeat protein